MSKSTTVCLSISRIWNSTSRKSARRRQRAGLQCAGTPVKVCLVSRLHFQALNLAAIDCSLLKTSTAPRAADLISLSSGRVSAHNGSTGRQCTAQRGRMPADACWQWCWAASCTVYDTIRYVCGMWYILCTQECRICCAHRERLEDGSYVIVLWGVVNGARDESHV